MSDPYRRNLTLREIEILSLIATGASAKEIARELHIAARTVEAHINHLKLKTSSKNRAHLVAIALQLGLITNPCLEIINIKSEGASAPERHPSSG